MRLDQTQLFKMEYGTRCDTFGCGEQGEYMVGRPDGPLNTSTVLCQVCTDSLVKSVNIQFGKKEVEIEVVDEAKEKETQKLEATISELLGNIKSHAQIDDFIRAFDVKLIPGRDEEGGKFQERKDAIQDALEKKGE